MLIHLGLYTCPLLPSINHLKKSVSVDKYLLRFKKSKRNNAADRESEFETDPEKAREALRKLDEQLQSLSTKKVSPPKIRGNCSVPNKTHLFW